MCPVRTVGCGCGCAHASSFRRALTTRALCGLWVRRGEQTPKAPPPLTTDLRGPGQAEFRKPAFAAPKSVKAQAKSKAGGGGGGGGDKKPSKRPRVIGVSMPPPKVKVKVSARVPPTFWPTRKEGCPHWLAARGRPPARTRAAHRTAPHRLVRPPCVFPPPHPFFFRCLVGTEGEEQGGGGEGHRVGPALQPERRRQNLPQRQVRLLSNRGPGGRSNLHRVLSAFTRSTFKRPLLSVFLSNDAYIGRKTPAEHLMWYG